MKEDFITPNFTYSLEVDKHVCNKFGIAEFFAKNCKIKNGLSVLDVGCGVGPLSIFLAYRRIILKQKLLQLIWIIMHAIFVVKIP